MSASLIVRGHAIQKQAHNLRCLLSRQSSSTGNTTDSSPMKVDGNQNNNALIGPVFYNRNPRNLELLTIDQKPDGYHLDNFNVKFWHKLVVKTNQSQITAEVIHNNGSTITSASSSEFGIRRFLYRPTDLSAYKTVGKVIARRCLESGINSVFCDTEAKDGTKLAFLLEEVEKGGLSLEEVESYTPPTKHSRGNPTKPWDIVS